MFGCRIVVHASQASIHICVVIYPVIRRTSYERPRKMLCGPPINHKIATKYERLRAQYEYKTFTHLCIDD